MIRKGWVKIDSIISHFETSGVYNQLILTSPTQATNRDEDDPATPTVLCGPRRCYLFPLKHVSVGSA